MNRNYHLPAQSVREVARIRTQATTHPDGDQCATIWMGDGGSLWITEPGTAKELLVAAAAALHILNPDLAQEAVAKLVADLLDTAFPGDPGLEAVVRAGQAVDVSHLAGAEHACKVCGVPVTGGEIGPDGVTWLCEDHCGDPAFAPGTAQPEDIPQASPSCARCGASSVVIFDDDSGAYRCYNADRCAERQAAKATRAPRAKDVGKMTCGAPSADVLHPWICTAAEGHAGDHVAYGTQGDALRTWPQNAEASR